MKSGPRRTPEKREKVVMTEREILERQESTGNREYFLVLVGSFLHAYGHGAFALSRATIVTFNSDYQDLAYNNNRSNGISVRLVRAVE